ncbi:MAG: hypothetical protein ACREJR_10640, partial [Candidatus Rokuibacteriota bacterium]
APAGQGRRGAVVIRVASACPADRRRASVKPAAWMPFHAPVLPRRNRDGRRLPDLPMEDPRFASDPASARLVVRVRHHRRVIGADRGGGEDATSRLRHLACA